MEALEDTWENLQKIIEVCRFYFVFFFSIKIQQVANAIILPWTFLTNGWKLIWFLSLDWVKIIIQLSSLGGEVFQKNMPITCQFFFHKLLLLRKSYSELSSMPNKLKGGFWIVWEYLASEMKWKIDYEFNVMYLRFVFRNARMICAKKPSVRSIMTTSGRNLHKLPTRSTLGSLIQGTMNKFASGEQWIIKL